jgi:hypothetical protein
MTMKDSRIRFAICVSGVVLSIAACSSSTGSESGNAALNALTSAFCSKVTSCCATVSQTACQTIFDGAFVQAGFDTSKNYTTDSVNTCTGEINALMCPATGCAFAFPADCPAAGQAFSFAGSGDASSE